MNHIEKMLQDYCPNGVEWKELGEVLDYEQPTKYIVNSKDYNEEYPIPVLTAGQTFILGYTNETEGVYAASKEKPIIIFDDFTTASKWVDFEFKVKSSAMKILTIQNEQVSKVLIRYVWHYLGTITYKPAQHGRQWIGTYSKIKIPIPPLKIQEEIVKILDKFTEYVTELTAELTAELTLRQKQYNYFRDYLLNFDSDSSGGANNKVYQVEWKMLKDIAKLKHGKDWKSLSVGDVPVYGSGGAMGEFVSEYAYNKPTVLIPRKGSISNLFYLEKPFWNVDTIYYTEIDESQIVPRYLYYYLTTIDLESMATNPTRPSLTQAILDKIPIPVPPLSIQQRIVQVLDNFDAVCNDLNIGLPKEIELRRKQYDYFREKLLTFTAEGVYTDSTVQYSTVQYSTVQYRQDLIRLFNWVFGTIRVELGAICTFTRGNGLQKKDFTEEGYPVIHYGQIYTRYGFSTDKTISFTDQSVFAKLRKAQPGDIVMATTSENVEDVGKAVVWEGNEEVGISGDAYIAKTTQHSRFLNYFFKSIHFQGQKEKKVTGTKVIRINAKDMEKFIINLPSLEKQFRIVSILDNFDELTTSISHGLPKEIELRQKQYEYFRDSLLNFPNKYE
ncbi:restriction endonuclease subunit S [Streptococcus suis]|uniref:restriction endonuclease subunit S n=1 Tax=Streptococcus suis TaxID=1307 RepID=UPI002117EBAC|nr:restriction endonuclease subunit S [Streptococcus suis]MCQ8262948.1 restriction endonuclease subunit S [Streptococcus suis]